MAHAIVRTDKMMGTTVGTYLVSVKLAANVDNGNFVAVGNNVTGENPRDTREVRAASAPAANTAIEKLALIAAPEVDKSNNAATPADCYNESGDVVRGYLLHEGDEFSVTADALTISGTPTVNTAVLEAQASYKGKLTNTATSGSTKIATLVAIEDQGATKWYVFRV